MKKERIDEAVAIIRAFVEAVTGEEGTLSYGSYRRPDGVSFVHTMVFADEAAEQAHGRTPHAKVFAAALAPQCVVAPRFTTLEEVATSRTG